MQQINEITEGMKQHKRCELINQHVQPMMNIQNELTVEDSAKSEDKVKTKQFQMPLAEQQVVAKKSKGLNSEDIQRIY